MSLLPGWDPHGASSLTFSDHSWVTHLGAFCCSHSFTCIAPQRRCFAHPGMFQISSANCCAVHGVGQGEGAQSWVLLNALAIPVLTGAAGDG